MAEAMSDERLAHLTAVFVDQDPRGWFAKDGLADVIRELLAEVEWLRRGLRLVLDQHHPIPCSNVRHDGGKGQHCAVCEYDDIETGWWPCPTARGAMAALGDAAPQQPAQDGGER